MTGAGDPQVKPFGPGDTQLAMALHSLQAKSCGTPGRHPRRLRGAATELRVAMFHGPTP